jgi:hypothetical protein
MTLHILRPVNPEANSVDFANAVGFGSRNAPFECSTGYVSNNNEVAPLTSSINGATSIKANGARN